jgi:acyl-CoA reductase-like NAD-dependent aldehyde dehydrogenase
MKSQVGRNKGQQPHVREPIGVCALITPRNWPLNQIAAKVAFPQRCRLHDDR